MQKSPFRQSIVTAMGIVALLGTSWVLLSATQQQPESASPQTEASKPAPVEEQVNWISINDALALNEKGKNKRPIFIDLYTDWCGWCKRMDATTLQDPKVVAYLNKHFHCVKFNAEKHPPVEYMGKTMSLPEGGRGTHPFAVMVGSQGGRIGYPTISILSDSNEKLKALPGFQTPERLDPHLVYYAEGYYRDFDFPTFQGMYVPLEQR